MTHRIRRCWPWFGAVAALLLLALPVQADDIEPEPYVEETVAEPEPEPEVEAKEAARPETAPAAASSGPSVGAKIFDCVVLRPFGFVVTIISGALFVPAAAFTSGVLFLPPTVYFEHSDRVRTVESFKDAWEYFVAPSAENTFTRPLGGDFR
jgi:hypothetical protein